MSLFGTRQITEAWGAYDASQAKLAPRYAVLLLGHALVLALCALADSPRLRGSQESRNTRGSYSALQVAWVDTMIAELKRLSPLVADELVPVEKAGKERRKERSFIQDLRALVYKLLRSSDPPGMARVLLGEGLCPRSATTTEQLAKKLRAVVSRAALPARLGVSAKLEEYWQSLNPRVSSAGALRALLASTTKAAAAAAEAEAATAAAAAAGSLTVPTNAGADAGERGSASPSATREPSSQGDDAAAAGASGAALSDGAAEAGARRGEAGAAEAEAAATAAAAAGSGGGGEEAAGGEEEAANGGGVAGGGEPNASGPAPGVAGRETFAPASADGSEHGDGESGGDEESEGVADANICTLLPVVVPAAPKPKGKGKGKGKGGFRVKKSAGAADGRPKAKKAAAATSAAAAEDIARCFCGHAAAITCAKCAASVCDACWSATACALLAEPAVPAAPEPAAREWHCAACLPRESLESARAAQAALDELLKRNAALLARLEAQSTAAQPARAQPARATRAEAAARIAVAQAEGAGGDSEGEEALGAADEAPRAPLSADVVASLRRLFAAEIKATHSRAAAPLVPGAADLLEVDLEQLAYFVIGQDRGGHGGFVSLIRNRGACSSCQRGGTKSGCTHENMRLEAGLVRRDDSDVALLAPGMRAASADAAARKEAAGWARLYRTPDGFWASFTKWNKVSYLFLQCVTGTGLSYTQANAEDFRAKVVAAMEERRR